MKEMKDWNLWKKSNENRSKKVLPFSFCNLFHKSVQVSPFPLPLFPFPFQPPAARVERSNKANQRRFEPLVAL
jgi:hypothetical protein